jgi:uncharacterized protein
MLVTLLEYIAGTVLERFLGLKLWDYSNQKLNIKGRICLNYSLYWAILISIFIFIVNPFVTVHILRLEYFHKLLIISFFTGVFVYDSIFTIFKMLNIKKIIEEINNKETWFNFDMIKNKFSNLTRIMNGFPDFSNKIRGAFDDALGTVYNDKDKDIFNIIRDTDPDNSGEYYNIIKDIIENPEFRKTGDYKHHHTSILEHSIYVSFYSYKLAKKLKLDFRSVARGALLHDFFLYDWKMPHPEKGKNHGIEHPKTALRNASRLFELNKIEKDIILNHMWPFTRTIPGEKETVTVLLVDKYMASREFFMEARKKIGKHILDLVNKEKKRM